jgi:hypothetical protein
MEILEKETNSGSQSNIQVDTREISPQGRYIRVLSCFILLWALILLFSLAGG